MTTSCRPQVFGGILDLAAIEYRFVQGGDRTEDDMLSGRMATFALAFAIFAGTTGSAFALMKSGGTTSSCSAGEKTVCSSGPPPVCRCVPDAKQTKKGATGGSSAPASFSGNKNGGAAKSKH